MLLSLTYSHHSVSAQIPVVAKAWKKNGTIIAIFAAEPDAALRKWLADLKPSDMHEQLLDIREVANEGRHWRSASERESTTPCS